MVFISDKDIGITIGSYNKELANCAMLYKNLQ